MRADSPKKKRGSDSAHHDKSHSSELQTTLRNRYPGAGPFQDDDISRKTFFGREKQVAELASRIEVCRLTIVYGRSGLGKSSLLQAGLTSPLRESGFFPVFVRVNHANDSLITVVADYIEDEAQRQGIEHVRGTPDSPWEYFKSVELWQNDRLLIPVIILDQFEEIFSVGSEDHQESIIEEVGLMLRGLPSSKNEDDLLSLEEKYGSSPPKLQIIIAIREDYLGHLEELAGEIPEIFDSRFRVTPLSIEAARTALVSPSKIVNECFKSTSFEIEEELVSQALEFLTSDSDITKRRRIYRIEPFQLQLVGRKIEEIAQQISENQNTERVSVSFKDIGGEEGLNRALSDFYATSLAGVASWRDRRRIKSLCLNHLISPDGKRLSIDEDTILRETGLGQDVLQKLTEKRLLRTDTRADTKYYELSHDTLVEPILASQGLSAKSLRLFKLYWLFNFFSSALVMAIFSLATALDSFKEDEAADGYLYIFLSVSVALASLWFFKLIRISYRNHTRLNRLLKLKKRTASFKKRFFKFLVSLTQFCVGMLVTVTAPLMAGYSVFEMPGKDKFHLDRLAIVAGSLALAVYGVGLAIRGLRNLLGVVVYKDSAIATQQSAPPLKRRLSRAFSLLFIILFTVTLLPLTSALDCTTDAMKSFSSLVSTLYLSDLELWCEEKSDSTLEDYFLGFIALLLVGFGLLRMHNFIYRILFR